MLTLNSLHSIAPLLYSKLPFDAAKDFAYVTPLVTFSNVLVVAPSVQAKSVQELVALAKREPGKLNFGSSGNGTNIHLVGELFKSQAGVDIVHVPYKGSGDAMKDHLTGRVQLFFDGAPTGMANARTGKVKLVAWAAETRNKALPDLRTMREAGYDVGMWGYLWFWGPGGMTPQTVDAVYRHLGRAIAHPDVRELMEKGGAEVSGLAPAETVRAARDLNERWGAVIRQLGVKLD